MWPKLRADSILFFLLIAVAAFIIAYPELMISHSVSFTVTGDYLIDYVKTFILSSFFYQGGIQLWDSYSQHPFSYYYSTLGMFQLPNFLTGLVYYIFYPFA